MIKAKSPYERTKKEPGDERKLPGFIKTALIEKPRNRPKAPNVREKRSVHRRYFDLGRYNDNFGSNAETPLTIR
jgi:hypothetical protein